MTELLELIKQFGVTGLILILCIILPPIFKFIGWCKHLWEVRESFKKQNFQQGREAEAEEEGEERRFSNGEARIGKLETSVNNLTETINALNKRLDLYLESDQLGIKAWLKEQHEKWMHIGAIDSHSLELVNRRFAIYKAEGGNGWAKKIVDDINGLPVVVNITLKGEEI